MSSSNYAPIKPSFTWPEIDTILLDMDGTLLDSYFDDYFWEEYVPVAFAAHHNLNPEQARQALLERYRSVEKTLQWSNVDYWSEQLELDIPGLKCTIDHLIQVHPHVINFLDFLQGEQKDICLVTAAHEKTIEIKLGKAAIGTYFDRIIPIEEIGEAKEQPPFWAELERVLGFDKDRTLMVDDNSNVLRAAKSHGVKHLVHIAKPSSKKPVRYSEEFPSIEFFKELLSGHYENRNPAAHP
ncbi:HAD-IA family hydrolase [Desulfosediminicola ganghwensis]|uniref:HAD-IA family hydrolase n=1 Tax=Desulfosediminicola ganghwensis TaxID=2569540 RepID=UPI0010AB5080|nr:HAD-IA family hydrolase [Desulfosediminicola ganghwensis]